MNLKAQPAPREEEPPAGEIAVRPAGAYIVAWVKARNGKVAQEIAVASARANGWILERMEWTPSRLPKKCPDKSRPFVERAKRCGEAYDVNRWLRDSPKH